MASGSSLNGGYIAFAVSSHEFQIPADVNWAGRLERTDGVPQPDRQSREQVTIAVHPHPPGRHVLEFKSPGAIGTGREAGY